MLEIQGLRAGYGDVEVLHGISFKVHQGELVSLVGGNGAGKTTTLMALSGVIPVREGQITLNGQSITNANPETVVEMGLIHVPEGRRVFWKLTVQENLELGAYSRRAKAHRRSSLERVYALFPRLAERRNQLAGTLSGGEQQMLAIGRGLMSLPTILMLDEPSLGLAPALVEVVYDVIEEIKKAGTTILLVEQNVNEALSISDRAYVLENGSIVLEGTGEELRENDAVRRAYLGI